MRIYKPQDEHGHDLLTYAAIRNASLKLDRELDSTGYITITADDIGDISEWTVSQATVKVDGVETPFQPEWRHTAEGNLIVRFFDLGQSADFSAVNLVLTREVYDAVKGRMVETPIDVLIRRRMNDTYAAIRDEGDSYDPDLNIEGWRALGQSAFEYGPQYSLATLEEWSEDMDPLPGPVVNECLISLGYLSMAGISSNIAQNATVWNSDLPCLKEAAFAFNYSAPNLVEFNAKMPNLHNGNGMFDSCDKLVSCTSELPLLEMGDFMYSGCTSLQHVAKSYPKLVAGPSMFGGCISLKDGPTSFPTLADGGGMFENCRLWKGSVIGILTSIPTVSGNSIDIGATALGENGCLEEASGGKYTLKPEVAAAISAAQAKGWNAKMQYFLEGQSSPIDPSLIVS